MLTDGQRKILVETLTFWDKLTPEQTNLLLKNAVAVTYAKGDRIHSSEQDCVGVLIVISGELRTYILSEDGKEVTIYRQRAGDICILSASCLLQNITFDVYIDAEQDTEALLIDSTIFAQLLDENVYVENFSLRLAADKFSDVMWSMEQILFMSFDKRLATFLLDESAKNSSDTINLTHEQIAKYIGSAREVVSRMIKYFATEGMVEPLRGAIKITDKAKLQKIAYV